MIPRRIVVATDGSPAALQAEVFAADQAELMAASGPVEVVVLTATHDVGHIEEDGGTIPSSQEALDAERTSEVGRAHIALLGSVSLDVVHRAHCPVVIVRE